MVKRYVNNPVVSRQLRSIIAKDLWKCEDIGDLNQSMYEPVLRDGHPLREYSSLKAEYP